MDNKRELLIKNYCHDNERMQYDGHDVDRLQDLAQELTHSAIKMIEGMGAFSEEIAANRTDEDAANDMAEARYDLIYGWTVMQAAVSKIAWACRIDGDFALAEALDAAYNKKDPFFDGL